MHELPPLLRTAALRQLVRDLIAREGLQSLCALLFLPHRHPRIRNQDVRVFNRFFGDGGLGQCSWGRNVVGRRLDNLEYGGRDGVALRRGDAYVNTEFQSADREVEKDVVGVSYPCYLQAFQAQTWRRQAPGWSGRKRLVDGEAVGDGLEGVVVVG